MAAPIRVHDYWFEPFIDRSQLAARVSELGLELAELEFATPPLFIGILRGGTIFHADLIRACAFDIHVEYLQTSSYEGLHSTDEVILGYNADFDFSDRDCVLVEDICDSGQTLAVLHRHLLNQQARSVRSVVMLDKPEARKVVYTPDYIGFSIPNRFVVGYGLDYKGLGRNLPDVYQLVSDEQH